MKNPEFLELSDVSEIHMDDADGIHTAQFLMQFASAMKLQCLFVVCDRFQQQRK